MTARHTKWLTSGIRRPRPLGDAKGSGCAGIGSGGSGGGKGRSALVVRDAGRDQGFFGRHRGQFTVVEVTCPPGYQGIRHIHHNEDEGFWILDGQLDLEIDGKHTLMHTGDYAFGPRNVPHGFSAGDAGARMLFILTPGGFENLIMATSEPAKTRTTPPHSDEMPDFARLKTILAQYGGEILV